MIWILIIYANALSPAIEQFASEETCNKVLYTWVKDGPHGAKGMCIQVDKK